MTKMHFTIHKIFSPLKVTEINRVKDHVTGLVSFARIDHDSVDKAD